MPAKVNPFGSDLCCPKSILCVDDTLFNLIPLTQMIETQCRIKSDTANDGQEAVNKYLAMINKPCKCPHRAYKLIFMDIQMPFLDGKEATKQIFEIQKKNAASLLDPEYTKIVFVTSYTNKNLDQEAEQLGVQKVYKKPIRAEDINQIMQMFYYI